MLPYEILRSVYIHDRQQHDCQQLWSSSSELTVQTLSESHNIILYALKIFCTIWITLVSASVAMHSLFKCRYIEAVRKLKCSGNQCDRSIHLCFVPGVLCLYGLNSDLLCYTQGDQVSRKHREIGEQENTIQCNIRSVIRCIRMQSTTAR